MGTGENEGGEMNRRKNRIEAIRKDVERYVQPVTRARNQFAFIESLFADIFRNHERDEEIAKAGWFPHPVLPLDEIKGELSKTPSDIDGFIEHHVKENWETIKGSIIDSEAFSKVSSEYKETLRQCVVAHEKGLYRCVPRTLFGEIEMASREVLKDAPLDNAINAGLKPVLKILGDLPVPALPDDLQSGALFSLLTDHVYHDSRHKSSSYKIPNRHDHMHGYSQSHPGFRESLNMLLLSEVMFRVLATFINHELVGEA